MKKIGLMSDTHSYLHPQVFKYFEKVDEIWHAGDIGTTTLADELEAFRPFRAVYGILMAGIYSCDILKIYSSKWKE